MRRISIIGFGKIGQAIAANILKRDIAVTAVDTNVQLKTAFEERTYESKEPGVKNVLLWGYADNKLVVTGDFSLIKGSDAVIVTVPLLVDSQKQTLAAPFLDAFKKIVPFVENKMVIITETSVPVGFNRNHVLPVLEAGGKTHGSDFLLAHSPERIKSGTMLHQLTQIPKIIGGLSKEATVKACDIYKWFFNEELLQPVGSIEAAEMLKLAGMLYRDVNIALSNQLAQFANTAGINFTDLIPLINTDKEANLLQPGIGVGGHCTPVYPYFFIENFSNAGLDFTLATQSRRINDHMAAYAVSLVKDKVQYKKALILGLSFRPNVKEDALSSTYLLYEALVKEGFDVYVHDTEFSGGEIIQRGLQPVSTIYDHACEVAFLVTMHKEYEEIDFEKLSAAGIKYFVDGRNKMSRDKIEKAGIRYFGIGR